MNKWTYNLNKRKKMFLLSIIMIVVYVVQFIVLPTLFPNYYRTSNEAAAMYWGTHCIAVILGSFYVSLNLFEWLIADIVYMILPCYYSANGAYGVGVLGDSLKARIIESTFNLVVLFIFQFIVLSITYLFKKIAHGNARSS